MHLINMDIQFVSSCESQRTMFAIVFKRPWKVNTFNMISGMNLLTIDLPTHLALIFSLVKAFSNLFNELLKHIFIA